MSTINQEFCKCAVCGKKSGYTVLCSTNSFGSPDLDLRPPQMKRGTMMWWVHECPHCGYVSSDVTDETSVTKDFLQTPKYKTCDGITFKSRLSTMFYKQHLINLCDNKKRSAFYALLYAAWSCDDDLDTENAVYCRRLALPVLTEIIDQDPDDKEGLMLMKADIMRRAALFDDLIDQYSSVSFSDDMLNKILSFQLSLAKEKDTDCYTVSYAAEHAEKP